MHGCGSHDPLREAHRYSWKRTIQPEIDLSLQLLVSMADNLEKALGLGNQY